MGFRKILRMLNPMYEYRKINTIRLEKEKWGVYEKEGIDFVSKQSSDSDGHNRYQVTRPQHLEYLNSFFEKQSITESDSILDVGCGKGGMLAFFSNYDFGAVDGLEYSEQLCEICRNNMDKLNLKASVINSDATAYEGLSNYNYFYLYNPFNEDLTRKFANQLLKSFNETSKYSRFYIIYTNPVNKHVFTDLGFIIVDEFQTTFSFREEAIVLSNRENGE